MIPVAFSLLLSLKNKLNHPYSYIRIPMKIQPIGNLIKKPN